MTTTKAKFNGGSSGENEKDVVESPQLSNSNALARFEFEPGRGNEGTKVLMVEWEEDDTTRDIAADWEISWEGTRTVLPSREDGGGGGAGRAGPAGDDEPDAAGPSSSPVNRLYFLLGPGVTVPTAVRLQKSAVVWRTNPLPAIFSPELGMTARSAGKKGVLHTVWAKRRLQALQAEIAAASLSSSSTSTSTATAESEKEWIETNFGVTARPSGQSSLHPPANPSSPGAVNSPVSPRSPGGGRLMDKLKGLKIDTTEQAARDAGAAAAASYPNPLSPESSDVAVGGFSSFAELKGLLPARDALAAKSPQPPAAAPQGARIVPQRPPDSFLAQQRRQAGGAAAAGGGGPGGMASLNAFASSQTTFPAGAAPAAEDEDDDDSGDDTDLFALPMSPRSPEMAQSPFTFAAQDVRGYASREPAS